MPTAQVILAVLALLFAVISGVPFKYNSYLLTVSVILLSIAFLVP